MLLGRRADGRNGISHRQVIMIKRLLFAAVVFFVKDSRFESYLE